MAFKISSATEGTYVWPVVVMLPIDGGKHQRQEFKGVFNKAFTLDDVTEGIEDLPKLLVGWSEIIDDNGKEVPFTQEALAEYSKVPIFVSAVFESWRNSFSQARAKN